MNIFADKKVILASQSPRRQELMRLLTEDFIVDVSEADETIPLEMSPDESVMLLARRKAEVVAVRHTDALVIGADTVVAADGGILGKPVDADDAARILARLSGRMHKVYTGVALLQAKHMHCFCCVTDVWMKQLTPEEIAWYVSTGEPFDKAGAYGIQGYAARFIQRISGDYFNVMGLPVNALYENIGYFTK